MSKWSIDASHSTVQFSVRHMMITNVRGQFQAVEGTVEFDPAQPGSARIEASLEVASIHTREEKRDAHLKSADFFDAEKYPKISFVSSEAISTGSGELELYGKLTIRDTTKDVTLLVEDLTPEHKDPWGQTRIGATAKTSIKRSDYGIVWNQALEAGGVLVGDEVKISLDVSLIRQG
jgi:polyisoprenoid-binding protein YceI